MLSASKSKVHFFYQAPVSLKNRTALKRFIESIFKKEKTSLSGLNYIFCSDKELMDINRKFLKHDFYTDIISFELSEGKGPVEGEIYISVDRVKDNSRSLGEPFYKELHRVIFHGALHLCGYGDKSKEEKLKMRRKEDAYLALYNS